MGKVVRRGLLALLVACALVVPGSEGWAGAVGDGDVLASQHRLLSAAGRYQEAARRPGGAPLGLTRLGRVYLKREQPRDASEAWRQAELLGATGPEVLLGLATALDRLGDTRSSLAALRRELDLRPRDSEAWSRLVQRAATAGLTREETAAALGAVAPPALDNLSGQKEAYLLGACLLGANSEEGQTALRRAALGPDRLVAALARELLDAVDAAQDARTKALALAGTLLGQDLIGPALSALEGTEWDRAGDARGLALRGYALMRAGRLDEAEPALRRALDTQPGLPLGEFLLGSLLRSRGDGEGAARMLARAAMDEPGNPAFYAELANALIGVGDVGDAQQSLKLAVKAAPEDPELRLAVVRFYVDRQFQVEDVLDDAREAVRLSGRSADALGALGWALQLTGKPREALASLQEAVAKEPESALLRYRLGSVYETLQQADRAREQYLLVSELDGPGEHRRRAAAALDGL